MKLRKPVKAWGYENGSTFFNSYSADGDITHDEVGFPCIIKPVYPDADCNGWIETALRKPKCGDIVLCCYVGVYPTVIATFDKDAGGTEHFWIHGEKIDSRPTTHWQPAPLTPKLPKKAKALKTLK